jgi:hypothetical protein
MVAFTALITSVMTVVINRIDAVAWSIAWESAKTVATEFQTFFKGTFVNIRSFMGAWASAIGDAVLNTLTDLGVNVKPLLDGIKSTWETIWNAVAAAIKPVQDAIASVQQCYREGARAVLMQMPTGCHRAGQPVLMFDGSTKPVESVDVGDMLMGPDGRHREVVRLYAGDGVDLVGAEP